MKQNKKQKPEAGEGFDETGELVETTGFDYGSIYAADEGVDADAVAHGPTRGEVEAGLQGLGLSRSEQAVVLAVVCDRLHKQADIARETKLNRKTVAAVLRSPKVKQSLQRLQRGELPAPDTQPARTSKGTLPGLLAALRDILDSERQGVWHYCGRERRPSRYGIKLPPNPRGWPRLHVFVLRTKTRQASEHCPKSGLATKLVECVREYPATLKHGTGLDWPAKLAEIIGAAKWGNPSERKDARETLAILTKGKAGNPVEYARHPARAGFAGLVGRLAALQREYRGTVGTGGTIAERLAALQQRHPAELNGFDPAGLRGILTREPLAVAVELAASATATSPDFWRDLARRERAEIEAALSPPRRRPS